MGIAEQDSLFYLWLALVVLGLFTVMFVARWHAQWKRRDMKTMTEREAKQHAGWLLGERIKVAMYAAELDKEIVDNWNAWPESYRPALWHIVRQAQLLEETQLHEAYERGVVPSRVFTREGLIAPPPPTPRPDDAPVDPPDFHDGAVAQVLPLSPRRAPKGSRWINGQLVRTA